MTRFSLNVLTKHDLFAALAVAAFALVVFTRVLAPDVLYSDSGEFQTLAYTWSTTHTTGYPVYLLFARIIGFLPVGTLAWRINFASAVFAAITLGGVYLITRHFTHRVGALLASIVLLLSYTFWSQSIIAEVYTLALAFIVIILLLLILWHEQPVQRRWLLFVAGLLLGAGLGVHLFLLLIAPSAFLFVLAGVLFGSAQERGRGLHLLRLILGGIVGLACFFLLFAWMDSRPTPTNLLTTSIASSYDIWGLQASDLDSVPERFWISVSGLQWRDRMVPDDVNYARELAAFQQNYLAREYSVPAVLLAALGVFAALRVSPRLFALLGVALATTFAAGFFYFPGDKYIFYLPFYLLLAVFAGIGGGSLVLLAGRLLPSRIPRLLPALLLTVLLLAVCANPFITSRWRSLQRGYSGFITEDYVYPVTRPNEPRAVAECIASTVVEAEAFLVLNWRALYSTYYITHVEQTRTGIVLREALPYPAQVMSPHLRSEITDRLRNGEAVYTDNNYPPLSGLFRFAPVPGECSSYRLFRLSLPD